jgi:hypothetical protein
MHTREHGAGCGCGCQNDAACWSVPSEFVRLRYFFGQRLGVVELHDEQAYHAGKQRFANLHEHGVGVLCGLGAQRQVFPAGAPPATPTTALRVNRGAALDGCGREIVVGADQCIDVAAWFAKKRTSSADLKDWGGPQDTLTDHPLWVAVRYRECPSDPAPAPRDPCGCDAGGCELARVREGFEMQILTLSQLGGAPPIFPASVTVPALEEGGRPSARTLAATIAIAVAGDCPQPAEADEGWLLLAKFSVVLGTQGGTPVITDITPPLVAIPPRASLLSTAFLQQMLLALGGAAGDAGLWGDGPTLGALDFEAGPAGSGKVFLPVTLAPVPEAPPASPPAPLAKDTILLGGVVVHAFDDSNPTAPKWAPPPGTFDVNFDDTASPPRFVVAWSGGLAAGRYRVTVGNDPVTPMVDTRMRPLRPGAFARHFRLITDATGALTLAPSLF